MEHFREDNEGKKDQQQIKEILISTGNINRGYIVRDVIFVAERFEANLFDAQVDPNEALAAIKEKLQTMAYSYGASAVINCQFTPEHITQNGKTCLEIFAYGTVVQFIQSTIGG